MKNKLHFIVIITLLLMSCQKSDNNDIKSIKITLDRLRIQNKYKELLITDREEIDNIVNDLKNSDRKVCKFLAYNSVIIYYKHHSTEYICNKLYFKDSTGATYALPFLNSLKKYMK